MSVKERGRYLKVCVIVFMLFIIMPDSQCKSTEVCECCESIKGCVSVWVEKTFHLLVK